VSEHDEPPESFTEPAELSARERGEREYRYESARRESRRADKPKGNDVVKQAKMTDAEFEAATIKLAGLDAERNAAREAANRAEDLSLAAFLTWNNFKREVIDAETQAREIDRLVAEAMSQPSEATP
jgi:hypothetical protein